MLKNLAQHFQLKNNESNETDDVLRLAKKSYENFVLQSSTRNLDDAISNYMKLLDIDPSIPESYYRLASLLWQKGEIDIDAAIEQCQNSIELDPKSINAKIHLGFFLDMAGDFDGACHEFEEAIDLNRFFSSRPRLGLALVLIKKMRATNPTFEDFSKAVQNLLTGTVMSLWDYSTLRILYRSFINNFSVFVYNLVGNLLNAMKKYNGAVKFYENALEKTGYSDVFYTKIGNIFLEKGDPHLALDCYQKALDANPDNAQVWVKMASLLQTYYRDDTEQIIKCYQNIVDFDPKNASIFYELGHLYIRLEDIFNAVYAFKKAVELEPDNPFYRNSLGYVLVQLSDFDKAIEEYQAAIKLNPDNEWTSIVCQALAAIFYQVKGNTDAAIASYKTSIMFDPKNAEAYISLGNIYHDKNILDKAIENYCQAITLDPDIAKVYCNLGLALWEKDHVEESIIAYHKAIELEDEYHIAYNNLGVAYLDGVGMPDLALEHFEIALSKNPNYTLAYYNAGRACETMKDQTKAAEYYQRALDLNIITEDLDAEEIQERIFNLFEA
ncbi:MAG: tetratricopeptide repeat protein [Candidatus Gastranaerophilales bacterium]|nr:tetratricopeptide repeat protein [Candidatus Gastranaerophilales bacterium]